MVTALLNSLLFFPARRLLATPDGPYEELWIDTEDGERLHAWLVRARGEASATVLLCHGNAGNIGDRVLHAALLNAVGFDVLLFDYRGYGRSSGRPSERGTYRDARAARTALEASAGRVLYLGESVGGAVALALACEHPPAGLVLMSTFTSVRDMARRHYPMVPPVAVPDAYPSLRLIRDLRAPLLILHGDRDAIVPLMHAEALYEAAPEPKRLHVIAGVGHNDLVTFAGEEWAAAIAEFSAAIR